MRYAVAETSEINPGINSKEWEKAEVGFVDKVLWDDASNAPTTTFKLLRGPEGISVYMHTDEKKLRCEVKEENGAICQDSCMEFFFKPTPWDERYLNFELNPKGVMHLGIGKNRYDRTLIYEDRAIFSIETVAKDGDWSLKYYIPDSFLAKWYPDIERLSRGNSTKVARANFYKCGEKTENSHYVSWSEVETEGPDFHVADFFGKLQF